MAKEKIQYRPISEILRTDEDRVLLMGMIDEVVRMKTKAAEIKEDIKSAVENAKGSLHIDPKLFRFMVDRAYNDDYAQQLEEGQERTEMLERLLSMAD